MTGECLYPQLMAKARAATSDESRIRAPFAGPTGAKRWLRTAEVTDRRGRAYGSGGFGCGWGRRPAAAIPFRTRPGHQARVTNRPRRPERWPGARPVPGPGPVLQRRLIGQLLRQHSRRGRRDRERRRWHRQRPDHGVQVVVQAALDRRPDPGLTQDLPGLSGGVAADQVMQHVPARPVLSGQAGTGQLGQRPPHQAECEMGMSDRLGRPVRLARSSGYLVSIQRFSAGRAGAKKSMSSWLTRSASS